MSRPEEIAPPEFFYNEDEAQKYTTNSRIMQIQSEMSERALELLELEEPSFLLDVGCGSGISGEVLTENNHFWVGLDISKSMLEVALQRETEGNLILSDIGEGFSFAPGVFDGAISVSALQWLCNAEKSSHVPYKRLSVFFESLYRALKRGSRAVFQFYPSHPQQIELITQAAVKSGFLADMIIDYPNSTKAKKYYLVLHNGSKRGFGVSEAKQDLDQVAVSKRTKHKKVKNRGKTREWIVNKKERQRKLGKEVRPDSKYTGRKRRDKF